MKITGCYWYWSNVLVPCANTVTTKEIPQGYRDDYINTGYRRPGMTARECIQSLFQWNNETINVWTHFFTLLFFIWKFSTLDVEYLRNRADFWPLLAFAIGACAYPTLSSIAHAFSSMPPHVRHICFFCDYAGVSIYSIGSSVAYFTYSTPTHIRESFIGSLHRPMNVLMSVFCCYVCCASRDQKWQSIQTAMRALSFAIPYVFTSLFVVYGIIISYYTQSLWFHCWQFFWGSLMAVTMTAKIPEKYYAEYFDIVGHSHQWFHVFVFICTNHQINAVILDMKELQNLNGIPSSSFTGTVGLVILVIALDAIIVVFFSYRLKSENNLSTNLKYE